VTEIDGVAPAHTRTYRNIVSAVGVPCADRMPLFVKNFSSDACFQQGCRRISGESLQDRHIRTLTTRQKQSKVVPQGLDPGSESCCTQRRMDDGACAGNQVRRLRISKLMAGGKLQSTWEYNMPLCWLIPPIIRRNKLNRCRSSATAWWRWQSLTGKAQRRYSLRPRY